MFLTMKILTSEVVPSTLYPDVKYTFRKFSQARHLNFQKDTAEARFRLRKMVKELQSLEPAPGQEAKGEDLLKFNNLSDEINMLVGQEINPKWIKHYLKSIEGLEFDDAPATVETFLSDAPADMYQECIQLIQKMAELTLEESKNSQ